MNRNGYIFLSKSTDKYAKTTDRFAIVKTLFDINVPDSNNVTSEIKNDKSNSRRSI